MKRVRLTVDDEEDVFVPLKEARLRPWGDTQLGPVTNPLLIPSILELVCTSLPIQALKECRGVCSMWKQEIERFLRKLKAIRLQGDDYSQAEALLSTKRNGYSCNVMSQLYCKQCCTSSDIFEKLVIYKGEFLHLMTLEKCHLNVCSFVNLMLTDAFPNLSFLVLKQNDYVDANGRKTIFVWDSASTDDQPVLKCLKSLEIDERGTGSQTTLRNIAAICPNLQKLTYSNCPVPALMNRCSVNFNKLEFLQIAPIDGRKMEYQYFAALTELKMQSLKTLFLYGMTPGGRKRMKALNGFLKSVSSTLMSLHLGQRILYHPEYKSKVESPFPIALPNLKRLSVGPGFIHSLSFLDKLPSVSSFTCNRIVAEDWEMVAKKGVPLINKSVSSLDLGDISHKALRLLSSGFPNVIRLELNVTRINDHDSVLRAIFDGFKQLQIFNIYDVSSQNLLTDSGVTGISSSVCESLRKSRKKRKHPPKRDHPYIGNLKNLIDLRLQYLSGNLTDISVQYGIKELKNLFALDLSKSLITDASLEMLAGAHMNLSVLYIRNCANISAKGIDTFRTKFPTCQVRI